MSGCKTTVKYPVFIDCNGINPDNQIEISYSSFSSSGEIYISTSDKPAIINLANSIKAGLMSPFQYALLSRADISTIIYSKGTQIVIDGNNKCGTITVSTGAIGNAGVLFSYDISSYILSNSIITFSDIYDNYAMGHYQVVCMQIDVTGKMILTIKDSITLEPFTAYRWSYQINS